MDSTDAYAGTFLVALERTFSASGDTARLRAFGGSVRQAVDAIRSTQQPDGLTWATPDYHAALLMDQAEAYAGLRAAASLARKLGAPSLETRAGSAPDAIRRAVTGMWQADESAFAVARFEDGSLDRAHWDTYYPDATGQAWVVAVGNGLWPQAPLIGRAIHASGLMAARPSSATTPLITANRGSHAARSIAPAATTATTSSPSQPSKTSTRRRSWVKP